VEVGLEWGNVQGPYTHVHTHTLPYLVFKNNFYSHRRLRVSYVGPFYTTEVNIWK